MPFKFKKGDIVKTDWGAFDAIEKQWTYEGKNYYILGYSVTHSNKEDELTLVCPAEKRLDLKGE